MLEHFIVVGCIGINAVLLVYNLRAACYWRRINALWLKLCADLWLLRNVARLLEDPNGVPDVARLRDYAAGKLRR